MRKVLLTLITIGFGVALPLVVLEIALRFLPYNEGLVVAPMDEEDSVYRFVPDRDFSYSQDWDLKNARTRHVNNAGFLSDIDYMTDSTAPLLAIIGDSYIEAIQVDWSETAQGRLSAELGDDMRVYGFGAAYAPLSQYVVWSRYVAETFNPDMLVVNVVGNDFDESLMPDHLQPGQRGMTFFTDAGDGTLALTPTPRHAESLVRRALRQSALVAYLYRNLQVGALPQMLAQRSTTDDEGEALYAGNTEAEASEERLARSYLAVDQFLRLLPLESGLRPEEILITLDGLRPELYDPERLAAAQESFAAQMMAFLWTKAASQGFEVINLQPLFIAHHEEAGERFEFPFNNHWNATGHAILADAIRDSATFARVFGER